MSHVLALDDDPDVLAALTRFLGNEAIQLSCYTRPAEAIEAVKGPEGAGIDLIISDLKMPEMDGLEFVAQVKKLRPELPIILVTAHGSVDTAIEAIRGGAFDYIMKPLTGGELKLTIQRALEFQRLGQDNLRLRQKIQEQESPTKLLGKSPAMRALNTLISRVAPTHSNILIQGESGTGKEVAAHSIHERGPRAGKPFIAINCAAIPETLLESELFGHAKGAFTGAVERRKGLFSEADGGTLFLDEIGDMPLSLQAKLLRVIQDRQVRAVGESQSREIDVRIIAATHRDLLHEAREGTFREDLYYRLSVIPMRIPPLRERAEDIPLLAEHFLRKTVAASPASPKNRKLSPEALKLLMSHSWPGNVRELENVIERAAVLTSGQLIRETDLVVNEPSASSESARPDFLNTALQNRITLDELERRYIQMVLAQVSDKKEEAARILGIDRKTLYRKLKSPTQLPS